MSKKKSSLIKDIHLTWWQAGLFKLATISFGIILALNFTDLFAQNMTLVWITFFVPGIYIVYVYFNQK